MNDLLRSRLRESYSQIASLSLKTWGTKEIVGPGSLAREADKSRGSMVYESGSKTKDLDLMTETLGNRIWW